MAYSNRLTLSSLAFWSFALSVALLPIGLGGDRPIPLGLAQAGLALSCICLALSPNLWHKLRFFTRLRWALSLLGIVLLWAFIQTQTFIPISWVHPLWKEAATVLKQPLHGTISVVPEDSLKGISRLFTYITAGFLGYVFAQDPRRAKQIIQTLWYAGSAICFYGLMIQIAGLNQVLWFEKTAYIDDLTATFINHNHFAIYAGMVLVCGTALLIQSWREIVGAAKPHHKVAAIRDWVFKKGMIQGLVLVMVLISIILSNSRAGLSLSLIGLGSYIFFYQIYLHAWRRAWIVGISMLVVVAAFIGIAASVSDHFAALFSDQSSIDRTRVYDLGWRILQDNPWLGYGINGFEPEFRLYRQDIIPEFNHAHNDILESLIDLGLPVGLLLWSSIALIGSGLWHGVRRRRQNGLFPTLALSVSLMVLAHAMVDFDLQIPGVALTWAALLGVGLAQSWRQSEKNVG